MGSLRKQPSDPPFLGRAAEEYFEAILPPAVIGVVIVVLGADHEFLRRHVSMPSWLVVALVLLAAAARHLVVKLPRLLPGLTETFLLTEHFIFPKGTIPCAQFWCAY